MYIPPGVVLSHSRWHRRSWLEGIRPQTPGLVALEFVPLRGNVAVSPCEIYVVLFPLPRVSRTSVSRAHLSGEACPRTFRSTHRTGYSLDTPSTCGAGL